MKSIRLYFFLMLFSFSSLFGSEISVSELENQIRVTQKSLEKFHFVNHLSKIQTKKIKYQDLSFIQLHVDGYSKNANNGDAQLPVVQELLNIPYGSQIIVNIINKEEEIINLSDYGVHDLIFPSQPSISKGEDAENVYFHYNELYYNYKGFHNQDIVKTEILGKMRGQTLAKLTLSPFAYNPTTNQLKIVTKLEVEIIFKNFDSDLHYKNKQKYYSSEFEHLYKKCINYIPMESSKDVITTYPVKYVIISDPMFQSALQPFIDWKIKKGFIVVEGYTNDPLVGNTTSSIHSFIKDMYDNATANDPAPTYLLIVGDEAQVPSFNGNTGSHISDMYYCEFDGGGDFYPEMYFGRFSATSSSDVEVQVNKTLTHEQYTFSDASFLDEVVLVAGVDASMAPTYGNGQINYGTDYYFNTAHNLTVHNYLYGSGTPITSDMPQASAAIISDISDGVGFANYTAHCGSSGWSDPSFENSDVSSLQNTDKYGLLIGNCCQSNKFDVSVCFGESLLRANNKGAVGYIGGSNNTYWDEDFWWAVGNGSISANPTYSSSGLATYDCLMHENGEQQQDWFITSGQMIHAGNLAVTQAGGSEQYYWEIYHLMGDPSLMPYIGVPTPLTVSHISAVPVGATSFTVNTEENAYVAISMNGVLLDAQLADVTGIVNLTFPAISNVGLADIVVTKQFKQPYISNVQVISPNGPYVIYASHNIDDILGNNDNKIDYSENIDMYLDLHNVGAVNATSVTVTVSTNDSYVTLVDSVISIPLITASQVITATIPISFLVDAYVPDQHLVTFDVNMSDNLGNSWTSVINETINAPLLEHINLTIDDSNSGNSNGKIDAGETLDLIVDVINLGNSTINNLVANLSITSSYVSINSAVSNITSIAANQQQSAIFNITVNNSTPVGTLAEFLFDVSDGNYMYNYTFNEIIGEIDEDYETGDFTQFSWVQGTYPWVIENVQIYEGSHSSRSALNLPDNEESELSVTVDVTAPGDISFWKYVSSEQDYDFLKFKINGSKIAEWSGEDMSWSFVSFPVSVGQNTFKWEYEKDGGWSQGQDCAWIDYIVFPPIDLGVSTVIENNIDFQLFPNPTMGIFNLTYNDNKEHYVEIFSVEGKVIDCFERQFTSTLIDIQKYPSGVYNVKILPEEITYQIVKQ